MRWVPLVERRGRRRIRVGYAAVETKDGRGPELFVDEVEDVNGWLYVMYRGHNRTGYRIVDVERYDQEELW